MSNLQKRKDWTGNRKSIYSTLGASSHSEHERQEQDYYATSPDCVELLLELETFQPLIWECAVGGGHIANVLKSHGHKVWATDIIDRGFEKTKLLDFLKIPENTAIPECDIITNPPYKYAQEFVETANKVLRSGSKIAMLLKLQFLEGKKRREMYKKFPPRTVYVSSSRLKCAMNGDFEAVGSSAVAYAWYIWEVGYKGDTVIKWFN